MKRSTCSSLVKRNRSGRSAAWLARLVRDQEVDGSNPFAPTILFNSIASEAVQEHCLCPHRCPHGKGCASARALLFLGNRECATDHSVHRAIGTGARRPLPCQFGGRIITKRFRTRPSVYPAGK